MAVRTYGWLLRFSKDDISQRAPGCSSPLDLLVSVCRLWRKASTRSVPGLLTSFAITLRTIGLLLAQVDPEVVEELWDFAEQHPGEQLTVSLENRTINLPGRTTYPFHIDDVTRQRLLGLS